LERFVAFFFFVGTPTLLVRVAVGCGRKPGMETSAGIQKWFLHSFWTVTSLLF
jgi:hypothetical protein